MSKTTRATNPLRRLTGGFYPAVGLVSTSALTDRLREDTRQLVTGRESDLPGLLQRWEEEHWACQRYVVVDVQTDNPVGLVSWTGPPYGAVPSYWLHPDVRGRRFGSAAIDALALEMKRRGVTRIADQVVIQTPAGKYDEESKALIRRLRSHFE